jgi:peptidoglycan DL-endopeptidase CwlO
VPEHKPALLRTTVVAATAAASAFFALAPAATGAAQENTASAAAVTSVVAPVSTGITAGPVAPTASTAPATAPVVEAAVQDVAATTALSPAALRLAAMNTALAQIGKPYRYGAAGPSAFDCSGLTSWAFKQNGVTIPRTSRAQSTFGTPVAKANLQPGDLVFFYKPVSHVAIYIGNGQVVHASTSGQPVKISPLANMPFNSARRV